MKIDLSQFDFAVFDMDGLMFNSEDLYRSAIEAMGLKRSKVFSDDIHRTMMGRSGLESIQVLSEAWKLNEPYEALRDERDARVLELAPNSLRKMPGLDAIISLTERAQLRRLVVTGSEPWVAEAFLAQVGLSDAFVEVITGDMVTKGKPEPDIYQLAIKKVGGTPDRCIAFEDSSNGVRAAKASGCYTVAVPNRHTSHEDVKEADLIVSSLEEFVRYTTMGL